MLKGVVSFRLPIHGNFRLRSSSFTAVSRLLFRGALAIFDHLCALFVSKIKDIFNSNYNVRNIFLITCENVSWCDNSRIYSLRAKALVELFWLLKIRIMLFVFNGSILFLKKSRFILSSNTRTFGHFKSCANF